MLDEVTEENGCLMVVPGTHKGPIHSLFKDGVFTGKMADEVESDMLARQSPVTGKVGSVCLMHTRLAHGSAAIRSDRPRGLYICVYSAADAVPIARNPMPSPNEGRIVRGVASPTARMIPLERSEEHTSELQSLMRISYAVFCLTKKKCKKIDKRNELT